ncbi:hypothetical protein MJ579_05040 [Klebsiella pneumoniae]|nr:hypothetical protein MJ579_05040 [Klebsiella pneumoniae]
MSTAIMLLLRIDYETRLEKPGVYTGCAMSGQEKAVDGDGGRAAGMCWDGGRTI